MPPSSHWSVFSSEGPLDFLSRGIMSLDYLLFWFVCCFCFVPFQVIRNRSNIEYSETKHYKQLHTQTTELKNRLDFCNFSIRTLKARAIHPFTNETGHLFYLSVSNLLIICYTVFLFAGKTATLSINKTLYFMFLLPNWYLKQTSIILRDRTIPYI